MKKTISKHDFIQEFADYRRENYFSREALELIFDYIEQYEDDVGEETELDVISICGDYTETTLLNFVNDYNLDIEDYIDEDTSDNDEFIYENYLNLVSKLITNHPSDYENYSILSEKLVEKEDEDGYFRILSIAERENDEWIESSTLFIITDIDYKYCGVTELYSEAEDLANDLLIEDFNFEIDNEKKIANWEDIDSEILAEAVLNYLRDRSAFVEFTDIGVVYQEW